MTKRLLAIAFAAACLLSVNMPARAIVGGSNAPAGAYPFMAAVFQNGSQICTGSVIAQRWVLTAAHCIEAGTYFVRVGNNDKRYGATINVDATIRHPAYDASVFTDDVGLLHLTSNAGVPSVILSGPGDDDLEVDGAVGRLVGWGDILPTGGLFSPNLLKHVDVNVVGDANCYGDPNTHDARTGVCDSGTLAGHCNGDSGGPLMAVKSGHWTQFGVVSNGITLLCAYGSTLMPGEVAEVNAPSIRDFIRNTAGV